MPTPPKKRGRPPKPTESLYTIELILGDDVFTSTGVTALEALQNLERPLKIVTKGLVVVHHGEKTKELFFMPLQLKRLFFPLGQKATAKMLGMNI